jgi:DNA-binding transcriptional ArsR family regulator
MGGGTVGRAATGGAGTRRAGVAELRALAHPLRLRILELFAEAPRTTMQAAALLREPPTRLYHHVNALERAGLLRLQETRPNRGTLEKWYAATATRFDRSPRARASAARAPKALPLAILEQARQELAALPERQRRRRWIAARLVVVGSRARVAEVGRKVRVFLASLGGGRKSDAATRGRPTPESSRTRWALTLTYAPAWPRAPARDLEPARGRH